MIEGKETARYPYCLYHPNGCLLPSGACETCGFDAREAARRKELPLVLCEDGKYRKIIRRRAK